MSQPAIQLKSGAESKGNISDEELGNYENDDRLPRTYLSTTFYKNKNFFIESQQLTKEEKMLLPFSGLQFGDTQGNPNALPGSGQNSNEFSRDNSYLNFAFNIKTSYELPVEKLDKIEQRQIIESFLDKKAKTHASYNFNKLQKVYGLQKTANVQNFSKLCYTQESPKHISNITGGILPYKIQNLSQQSPSNKFFNKDLQINCTSKWRFDQLDILVSRSDQMEIVNMNPKASIQIHDVLSSSPELEIYYEIKVTFPYKLAPGEKMTMQLVLTPETYGKFEAAIFVLFDNYVFIEPISGEVSQNVYKLEPTYVTDVLVNESLQFSFDVYNHKLNEDLIIRNLYPSVEYFQSYWPNGVKVEDKLDFEKLNDTFVSQFLKVKPQGTKQIMTFNFQVDQPGDYQTAIVMITSFGDFMQIPFYFHVHTDPIKFYPTIVDFGQIARNFDLVKVNIRTKVKNSIDNFAVQDIFVPIDDDRLDFLMTDSKKLNQDKKPLKKGSDLTPIGSVILNPTSDGLIDSKIIMILSQYSSSSNQTIRIEIPIIGYITNDSLLVTGNSSQIKKAQPQPNDDGRKSNQQPSPLAKFDISPYMLNDSVNLVLFKVPQFQHEKLYSAFYFTNNFNYPIFLKDILNSNPEVNIEIVPEIKYKLDNTNDGMMIQPNQSIRIAWIELKTELLRISSGSKFIAIQVNDTIVPLSIAIYDRNLLCVWEEEYSQIRFTQCKQGYDINFGSVATNEPKYRKVNITNMNPMEIIIDSITKGSDDMAVFVEKIYYKSQKIAEYTFLEGFSDNSTSQFALSGGSTKKKTNIKLKIGRFETYTIVFMVKAKEAKQVSSTINFITSGSENIDFSFNYNYHIIEGQLTLMPYQLYYDPAFPGILQHKTITAKSTFDVPIVIKQIICSDPRIQPKLMNNVIMPKNKSELAILTFDPAKTGLAAIIPQIQQLQSQGNNNQQGIQSQMSQIDLQQLFAGQIQNAHGGGAVQQMNPQVFNLINGAHVIIQNNQGGSGQAFLGIGGGMQNMMKQALNIQELFQWREKQKSWEKLGSLGKTEIQAKVTIETNIFQNIEIPVKAYLTRPQIVVSPEDDVLNFELVQIGTQVMKNIKIYNPSDDPLTVQLYLANEEYFKFEGQINEQSEKQSNYEKEFYRIMHNGSRRMKALKKGSDGVTLNEDTMNNSQNDMLDNDNGLEKECYISMYCASKLKDNYAFEDNSEMDELLVNTKINIEQLCLQLLDLADDYSLDDPELESSILKNIEPFFKELYIAEFGGGSSGANQGNGDQINLSQLLQNGNQFQWDKQQQQFTGSQTLMNQQTQNELKLQVDHIHTLTMASQIDNLVKGLQKNNQRSIFELGYYGGIMDQVKAFMRALFYDNYPGSSQPVVPFKLKNEFLQDLMMNNGSLFKAQYQYLLKDHQYSPELSQSSVQSFFINPKIQNKYYTVDPKRNLTITDAVIFYPQSIKQQQSQMTLLIRNNLTILYPLELRGSGGTGIIEFIKVIKKASNETNQFQDLLMNEKFNNSYVLNTSSPEVRDKIIQFIYGGTDDQNDTLLNQGGSQNQQKAGFNKHQNTNTKKDSHDSEKVILFSISIEDLLQFDQDGQHDIFQNYDSQQFSQLDLLLSDKSHQIKVNNYHKRILIAKNTGNMPISINNILVEGKKCQSNGLVVENCHAFNLIPGDTHQIHLSYITDFSLAKIKKTLTLESQYYSLDYVIQVQIPIRFLSLAHQMVPLNQVEESLYISMAMAIIVVGSAILFYGFKGVVSHIKYSKDLFEQNQKQTILDTLKEKKKGESKLFVKRGGISIPIIKDAIGSDSITSQYQFVMEKFENQNSLFLKEISNICGKKNMVILDAQRQAQEAEKERNKQNRMNLQKYFEKKSKEDQSSSFNPVSSYIKELQDSYQPILSENQRYREQKAKENQEREFKLQANYAKEEEKKQSEYKKMMSQSEQQVASMAPLVLEKCSRSNTIDSAAALNTSSLDQSREGKQSDDKVSINDDSTSKNKQQQVQQKKKNQTKQNKKQIQRREEILKQQELQSQRQKQETEIQQRTQHRNQYEESKKTAVVSKVSIIEVEEEELKESFQQDRFNEVNVSKREQPCNEQVATDQKLYEEEKHQNEVSRLSSSENIEEPQLIEIYDQSESPDNRANMPISELEQSQIEQKGVSDYERQEDRIQEQQIMQIIEDPLKQQDDEIKVESDIQNDSYEANISQKKDDDISIEILPSTPENQQQIINERKDSGDATHESKKQNNQEQNEQQQIPTNSQQQSKKQFPGQIIAGQTSSHGAVYQTKKGQREQTARTSIPQSQQQQQLAYQRVKPIGGSSIPATNVNYQQAYYQKRGQSGPGIYNQGRGSSSSYNYNVKRPVGGWIKGSNNYYQEEENPRGNQFAYQQPPQQQQYSATPQSSNTMNAPVGGGSKRIVTNTLKNITPQQPGKYAKGRGASTSSYYTNKNMNNADFDDEYYDQQQPYYKRSRDEYDEDSYIDYNSGSNTYSNTNRFYAKKNSNMSKYQHDIVSDRRDGGENGTNRRGQDEEEYDYEDDNYQEDQRPSKNNSTSSNKYVKEFAYQKSDRSQNRGGSIGDEQYTQSQNEEEDSTIKSSNMLNQLSSNSNRESQAKTQKLSKNELEPFFESKNKEKQYLQQQHQSDQNVSMSGPNSTNKPFSQFSNQPQFQMNQNEEESKSRTPKNHSQVAPSEHNQTDSDAENQNSSQKREIDFFNVFNQVNSVFQYGVFGRTNQEQNEEQQQEKFGRKQVFDYHQEHLDDKIYDQNQRETTEENEEDFEGEQSSSLFTKSLFGRHPMFGGSKISSNFGATNKQSNNVTDYSEQQQRGATSGAINSGGSFSLFELRKESKPVNTYSLFDNMAYRPSNSNQYDGGKQTKGIWSGKHFQEDDDEDQASDDNRQK